MMPTSRAKTAAAESRSFMAEVTGNAEVAPGYYDLRLRPEGPVRAPKPGQFYMVGVSSTMDPLLKRPFCYFNSEGGELGILYRVVGRGTKLLSAMRTGTVLPVLGPLGNWWPEPGEKPLLLAGGIGMASLCPLLKSLPAGATFIYGTKCAHDLVMLEELKSTGVELITITDDGSCGRQGNVTDVLGEIDPGPERQILACGPKPMLRALAAFAAGRGIKGHVSLEERMACGIGACLGCAVRTRRGMEGVCSSGPIFKLQDVIWEDY